jgi:hypothetical protein
MASTPDRTRLFALPAMQSTGEQGIRIKSLKFLWQLPIYHPEQCAGTPAEKGAMGNSLFPTYTPGEHRVTTSMLAVLRSLALGRIERLLGALLEQSASELVRCQHRPSRGALGWPNMPNRTGGKPRDGTPEECLSAPPPADHEVWSRDRVGVRERKPLD